MVLPIVDSLFYHLQSVLPFITQNSLRTVMHPFILKTFSNWCIVTSVVIIQRTYLVIFKYVYMTLFNKGHKVRMKLGVHMAQLVRNEYSTV